MVYTEIFSRDFFSRNFASFSLNSFSRKNSKISEKVCEIRTKIFALFCETFRSLETLHRTLIGLDQLLKLLGFSLYTLFYFAFTVPLNKAAVKITTFKPFTVKVRSGWMIDLPIPKKYL